ncbi:hypothetical protein BKH40_05870 [Helicobacter sp. 11S02629-2]|nr:hypothetical protein BKH40_05870 [Helicobacter sp. 11S02629-2]
MVLEVKNLNASNGFALKDINLSLSKGERLGLVGKSGSGKSLLSRLIVRLESNFTIQSGEIDFLGANLLKLKSIRSLLGRELSYIPQEPLSALNPLHKIKKQILEPLKIHKTKSNDLDSLLKRLELDKSLLDRYPHELSGGQRQRVLLAIGLINFPKLVICDEPTTALDANLSLEIIKLLKEICEEREIATLFITHDLKLLSHFTSRVCIMKDGQIVEKVDSLSDIKSEYGKLLYDASNLPVREEKSLQERVKVLETKDFSVGTIKHFFFQKRFKSIISDVSLALHEGTTFGVVGQSGSGKSTLALGLNVLMSSQGSLKVFGKTLIQSGKLDKLYLKEVRKKMQIIFQDPFSSLNPRLRVKDIVSEGLLNTTMTKGEKLQTVTKTLNLLELDSSLLNRFPSELSGGERQRVSIARALAVGAKILVLDEPTSALDKVVQKTTLNLLNSLQEKLSLSYILITHDLQVLAHMCDYVAVIFEGRCIEQGSLKEVLANPKDNYTKSLFKALD